jgi:tetratricopeptide (TPR) repeat protein
VVLLTANQCTFHIVRAEYRLALALGELLARIGKERDDAFPTLLSCFLQGISRLFLGEFVAARTLLERSMDLADPAHRTVEGMAYDPYAVVLAWLAVILPPLGYIDQGRSRMDEAVSEARRLRHTQTLGVVLTQRAWFDTLIRSPAVHIDELQILATEHGFPHYLGMALVCRGGSLITLGRAQEGVALVTQGLAELRAIGSAFCTSARLIGLAEGYTSLGQLAEQQNCLDEAEKFVESTEERIIEAELHRVRGDLLIRGDHAAAEQRYHQAIAIAERQSAKLFQLRASTSLARLWRDQGRRAEAHDLLAPIYGWFTEGFDAPDLKEAKALLDELA